MRKQKNKEARPADWDRFYKKDLIPWKSRGLSSIVKRYLSSYARGNKVLEVGCGSGEDTRGFIKAGFSYFGLDLSSEAVKIARSRNPHAKFGVGDFFKWSAKKHFSIVYDKGAFHNLAGPRRRAAFARRVASQLKKGGIWITVSGSADNFNPAVPHGAIFLQHLIEPVERYFEVLEVKKAPYESVDSTFEAWYAVFRRR